MVIALVPVLLVAAISGSPAASADVLCSTGSEPCSGSIYPEGQEIKGTTSGTAMFTGSLPVQCSSSSTTMRVVSIGGPQVTGEMTALSFSGCKGPFGVSCTAATSLAGGGNYAAAIDATSGGNGTLTLKEGSKKPTVTLTCTGIGTCKFGASELVLQFTGSSTAPSFNAKGGTESDLQFEEGFCGANTQLLASYAVTTPTALFALVGGAALQLTAPTGVTFTVGQQRQITLKNLTAGNLAITGEGITGSSPTHFDWVVGAPKCLTTLAAKGTAGDSCSVELKCLTAGENNYEAKAAGVWYAITLKCDP
jgi:hypothetical protein